MVDTPYQQLGGSSGVRALVDRFYHLMDTLPEARSVRAIHPEDLSQAREALVRFLSSWLGGPAMAGGGCGRLRLRARHLPFSLDGSERQEWLLCVERALEELHVEASLRPLIAEAFQRMADLLQSQYMCHALGSIEMRKPCCRRNECDETQK